MSVLELKLQTCQNLYNRWKVLAGEGKSFVMMATGVMLSLIKQGVGNAVLPFICILKKRHT